MRITEKTKDYLRLALSSLFLLALISLLMACGGSGAGGAFGASDGGNTVSGRMALSGASTARTLAATTTAATATTSKAYTTATVQLVDSVGNVVYETTTDENGKFEFNNVTAGDYTMVVIDIKTGEAMTQVSVSLLEGDDVSLEGVIDKAKTEWTINFISNDEDSSDLLENDEQMDNAKILAKASGLTLDEVIDMRLSGMGWGEIAKQLGVDPGALGLDNDEAFETEQTTGSSGASVGSSMDDGEDKSDDQGESNDHGYQSKPANNGGSASSGEHDDDKEDD
ncbi:hypothetical protein MNBD_NITROSPINAE04-1984 [hydrothermal vent metagenome]|uniref:Rhamnogalacturonan lyase domain-containing protein n=1 Tax=hydrothermal vent metagenome TaxID=652676 RepID=A0A3B1BSX6_9ZZZZ